MHQNSISAGAPPQTPMGKLTALPKPSSWILEALLLSEEEGRGREGRENPMFQILKKPCLSIDSETPLENDWNLRCMLGVCNLSLKD